MFKSLNMKLLAVYTYTLIVCGGPCNLRSNIKVLRWGKKSKQGDAMRRGCPPIITCVTLLLLGYTNYK